MNNRTTRTIVGLFVLVTLGLTSCKEKEPIQEEIVFINAEEYLKSRMNDPKSYEFVRIEIIDSILFSDNIKYRINFFSRNMDYDRNSLERQERYRIDIPSMYDQKEVQELIDKIE